jgi:hypothetical protein
MLNSTTNVYKMKREILGLCSKFSKGLTRPERKFNEKLGFPFEETRVVNFEGRSSYIGDCVNTDGEVLARFACIGKSPHWPCASLVNIT